MSSFISSIVQAAPLVHALKKAAGLKDEDALEELDDSTGHGQVIINYEIGPYWIDVWASQLMNAKPEFSACGVGIGFGFCPDFLWGWSNAMVGFKNHAGNDVWTLELEVEKPDQAPREEDPVLPEAVRQWYLDSANAMVAELGFDVTSALQTDGILLGDTIEALPIIRRASSIFRARAQNVPFDVGKYKR